MNSSEGANSNIFRAAFLNAALMPPKERRFHAPPSFLPLV
jgi:hypothetical protein